jgi:hypothetical protein
MRLDARLAQDPAHELTHPLAFMIAVDRKMRRPLTTGLCISEHSSLADPDKPCCAHTSGSKIRRIECFDPDDNYCAAADMMLVLSQSIER